MAPVLPNALPNNLMDPLLILSVTQLLGTLFLIAPHLVLPVNPLVIMPLIGKISPLFVPLTSLPVNLIPLLLIKESLIVTFPVPQNAHATLLLMTIPLVPLRRRPTMLTPEDIPELFKTVMNGCIGPLMVLFKNPTLPLKRHFVMVLPLPVPTVLETLMPEVREWRVALKVLPMNMLLRDV